MDQTRIHPSNYESVYAIVTDVLGENPDVGKRIVNDLIADPEKLSTLAKSDVIREQIKKNDQTGLRTFYSRIFRVL